MTNKDWLIGPLGDLRALPCPEVDVQVKLARYGGVHQGLSGARIVDITGFRSDYTLQFKHLDKQEYAWMEALYTKVCPGRIHLINPLKTNLLSQQASAMTAGERGFRVGGTTGFSKEFPLDLGIPGRSLRLTSWSGSFNQLVFDDKRPISVSSIGPLLASVYLKAESQVNLTLRAYWYSTDDSGTSALSQTDVAITAGTEWSRHWGVFLEPPSGACGAIFALVFGTAGPIVSVAAPQVEYGNTPTAFGVGGGTARVLIDQMPEVSHRFPLRDVEVTLLET